MNLSMFLQSPGLAWISFSAWLAFGVSHRRQGQIYMRPVDQVSEMHCTSFMIIVLAT